MAEIEGAQVVLMTKDWQFEQSVDGSTGIRIYLEPSEGHTPAGEMEELPKVGDSWDSNNSNLTLKNISKSYLMDNPNCGTLYTCTYSSSPYILRIGSSAEDLPRSIEISGEFETWSPEGNGDIAVAKWQSDNEPIKNQVLPVKVGLATIRIKRVITDFKLYTNLMLNIANTLNDVAFLGFPIGSVMFIGGNTSQFKNKMGSDRWQVDLLFAVRGIDANRDFNVDEDSWQKEIREDTLTWDIPIINASYKLYRYSDFTLLFETDPLSDEDNLYHPFPTN